MKRAKRKASPEDDFMKRAFELMDMGYREPEVIGSPILNARFREELRRKRESERDARAARRRRKS